MIQRTIMKYQSAYKLLTLRSNFLFSNSIRKSVSHSVIQRISESEEQFLDISQTMKFLKIPLKIYIN